LELASRDQVGGDLHLGARDPQVEEAKARVRALWRECQTADSFECDGETWAFDDYGTLYCGDLSLASTNAALGHDVAPRVDALRRYLAKSDRVREAALQMRDEVMGIAEQGRLLANQLAPLLTAGHAILVNRREYWFDGDDGTKFGAEATHLFALAGVLSGDEPHSAPPKSAMIKAYRNLALDREAILAVLTEFSDYQRESDSEVLATGRGSKAFVYRTLHGVLGWPYARSVSRARESAVPGPVFPRELNEDERLAATMDRMDNSAYATWIFWNGRASGVTAITSSHTQHVETLNRTIHKHWIATYVGLRTVGVEAVAVASGVLVDASTTDIAFAAAFGLPSSILFWGLRSLFLVDRGRHRSSRSGRMIVRRAERRLAAKQPQPGGPRPSAALSAR
jgi:hypothetical protein